MHQKLIFEEWTQRKCWSDRQDEFTFPIEDGAAKLPGKDNEFRKPILRLEQPVRYQWRNSRRIGRVSICQPTDDAGARADFRSMKGSFIYLHHNEPRVQLYAPKEETFTFPLKYIDVTRSTHTDLGVLPEKKMMTTGMSTRTSICQNIGEDSRSSPHWSKTSNRIFVVREETDKNAGDYQTRSCMSRNFDENGESSSESRKRTMSERSSKKWKKFILLIQTIRKIQKHSFMREESWKALWPKPCRVKEKRSSIQASGNWKRSHKLAMAKNSNQCMDVWWNPMNPQGNAQNLRNRKTWRSHSWVRG